MDIRRGILSGVAAYVVWGGSPVFWNAVKHVPAQEVLSWRVLWALFFLLIVVAIRRRGPRLRAALGRGRTFRIGVAAGALLTVNWALFLWAVTHEHIVDVSLGYYINPLMSVVLGVVMMREQLRPAVKVSVAIAACGVLVMTFSAGRAPWISLCLAVTFALYGLLKKQTDAAQPLEGLTIEVGTAAIPLGLYLLYLIADGRSQVVMTADYLTWLPFTGVITVVPLLLFGISAQLIPLSMVGMLQYLAPSIQLALGLMLYGESLNSGQALGFVTIWIALGIYAIDSVRAARSLDSPSSTP